MAGVVNNVENALRETEHVHIHVDLYHAIMYIFGYIREVLVTRF